MVVLDALPELAANGVISAGLSLMAPYTSPQLNVHPLNGPGLNRGQALSPSLIDVDTRYVNTYNRGAGLARDEAGETVHKRKNKQTPHSSRWAAFFACGVTVGVNGPGCGVRAAFQRNSADLVEGR